MKRGKGSKRQDERRRAGWRERRTRYGEEEKGRRGRRRTEGEEKMGRKLGSGGTHAAIFRPTTSSGAGLQTPGCRGSTSTEELTVGQGPAGRPRWLQLPMLGELVQPPMLRDPVPEAPQPGNRCFSPP